jgi:hypothetical protein
MVTRLLAAGGGFLLAVLWFDLMFDAQVLRTAHADGVLDDRVLASIAAYYARVTTEAYPMSHLVGAVMLLTVAGALWQMVWGPVALVLRIAAFFLAAGPIALAGARVLPNAVRLGTRADGLAEQSGLARAIFRDHVLCFAAIGSFVAIELFGGP